MEVSKKIVFIKDWILNYVNSMPVKAQSLVIGISGGIDSALTSTLCAMTGCKTISVIMPILQNPDHTKRGEEHCDWLKKKYTNIINSTNIIKEGKTTGVVSVVIINES